MRVLGSTTAGHWLDLRDGSSLLETAVRRIRGTAGTSPIAAAAVRAYRRGRPVGDAGRR